MEHFDRVFDKIQEQLWQFAAHRVLTTASRTGILEAIAGEALAPRDVAKRLGLDPLATGKMLRALSAIGIAAPEGTGYRLTDGICELFGDTHDLGGFLEHSHRMYESWGANLEGWVRGEGWRSSQSAGGFDSAFAEAMRSMARYTAPRVIEAVAPTSARRLLDVGGGVGTYAQAYCDAVAALQATVLDLPEVVAYGRETLEARYADKIRFEGGDYMTVEWGTDYDLVQLANIIHMESAPRAQKLVDKAFAALEPGGRIAIVDFAIDDDQDRTALGALFAINMRSFGDTYPEPTLHGWLSRAGFAAPETTPVGRHRWVITGTKPGA
jgi:SAM-dependent methyltransferase